MDFLQNHVVKTKYSLLVAGYLAIFSDEASLNYLKKVLRTIHEVDGGQTDSFLNLPMILVLASDSAREDNINFLRRDGQDLADQ